MLKKVLIGGIALVLVLGIGLFFWARAVLGTDAVRTTLAAQLANALGQPVTIGTVGATIYPRVTVNLGDVSIGSPARIKVGTLHVGTDLGALLSRRIEHASLNLTGARIELPLPDFAVAGGSSGSSDAPGGSPVEIVSIDEIVLRDVEIVSGGRTLRGDVEVVPQGNGFVIRTATLGADSANIEITGQITDLAGPAGELTIAAGTLDFNSLQQFASDFSRGAVGDQPAAPASAGTGASSSTMNLTVSLQAERASLGSLNIETLAGTGRITPEAMTLQPISFGLFGGKYEGSLALTLAATPEFRLNAKVAGIDMAAATAFAGSPNTITGRLAGQIELTGRGMDAPSVLKTARGTARIDITNGTVKNLGLIQTIVVATSGRADATTPARDSRDEPFSHLGGTLNISGGFASTTDLRFESKDLLLAAGGALKLDGSAINLQGQVQLSDELSQQAGRDLVRYTQDQGRVTLPASITGTSSSPQVRIDVASMAKRAVTNRATEEAQKALKKGLGGLFRK